MLVGIPGSASRGGMGGFCCAFQGKTQQKAASAPGQAGGAGEMRARLWFMPREGFSQGSVRNEPSVTLVISSHEQINTKPPERLCCSVGAQ